MTKPAKRPDIPLLWHCVIDLQGRMLYLGNNALEANQTSLPGMILRSSHRMGDAMRAAALAFGAALQSRK